MTPRDFFASLGAIALIAAGVLAILGWVVAMPDGRRRFSLRMWMWLCLAAMVAFSFLSLRHPRWWNWALMIGGATFCSVRITHWWNQLELIRRFEREVARLRSRSAR